MLSDVELLKTKFIQYSDALPRYRYFIDNIIIIIIINVHLETLYIVGYNYITAFTKTKGYKNYIYTCIYIHSSVRLLNYNYVLGKDI